MERTCAAAQVAAALSLSPDSIGRYAREGRIPFSATPGGHRRFNIDEVRQALAPAGSAAGGRVFSVSPATLRRRRIRSVATPDLPGEAQPAKDGSAVSAAEALFAAAWRIQRSVPLTSASR